MKSKKILLIGGGGHCRSVLDCLFGLDEYDEIGIIDHNLYGKSQVLGVPVVGTDDELSQLFAQGWEYAIISLGSIGMPTRRRTLFQTLKAIGFKLPAIADPSARIGTASKIGEGAFVGKQAIVNCGVQIGSCAIINTGAIVEHDCAIGRFAHISPGATLCGAVNVGDNTHIGAGAVVCQQIEIGCNAVIGAGSVIIHDVPENCTVVGNPGRIIKRAEGYLEQTGGA